MKQLLYTLFFLSFLFPSISSATHLVGGELSYECINPCTYRIHHRSYFDCSGGATTPPPGITSPPNIVFSGTSSSAPGGVCNTQPQQIGNWVFVHHIEITPICPSLLGSTACNGGTFYNGISEGYYYADYDMCQPGSTPCSQYNVSWYSCCRNGSITSGAANQSIYVDMDFVIDSTNCNTSPQFNHPPKSYICEGTSAILDYSATDAEGDSLVYELLPAQTDSSSIVTYAPGYSPQQFLGPTWNTSMDPTTGFLSLIPDSTGSVVTSIARIDVKEYRNGVFIGRISRDFQVTVIPCNTSSQVSLTSIQNVTNATLLNPDKLEVCQGETAMFEFTGSDIDPNESITIMSNILSQFPSAVLTQTGTNPAIYSVSITPGPQHAGNTYSLFINAEDNGCPIPTSTSSNFDLKVITTCLISTITSSNCNASNGNIDVTLQNAVPPIQYLWNTGATTEDLANISSGIYWVTATDSLGLVYTDTFLVNSIDITINETIVQPSCNAPDGVIFPTVSGGTMPYTYSWTNGVTTLANGNLNPGGYTLYVYDSLNCFSHKAYVLDQPDSCYVLVSGRAYLDVNNNCIYDAGDYPLVNSYIDYTPGGAVFTDINGEYSFKADTGTYTVEYNNPIHPAAACGSGNFQTLTFSTFNDDTTGIDFPIDTTVINDLKVSGLTSNNIVAGFPQQYIINYRNDGSVPMNGTVEFVHDPNVIYNTSFPVGTYDPATNTTTWSFSNLAPGQNYNVSVSANLPGTAGIGTLVTSTATVKPILGDFTPGNNIYTWTDTSVAAYDPNDKQVTPGGIGSQGFIQTTDSVLTYNVRFQNTGNFPATFVIIEDLIDENLDISTFNAGASSHPYSVVANNDEKLVFTFNNINLPDSSTDLAGSQGFIQFSLKQKPNLPIGTVITNEAAIIFDFNTPIITNQVTNTIFDYPEIGITTLEDTLCEGSDFTAELTAFAMPPYTYNWQPIGQNYQTPDSVHSIPVSDSDWYTVIVTDAFGFSDTASQYVNVIKNPVSDFSYQANSLMVDFTDNSSHTDTWMWIFGDGNTSTDQNPQHTFGKDSTYQVMLITSNECGDDTLKQVIEVSSGVSIDNEAFRRSVSIAPNPFSESVMISFDNPSLQPMELKLMDAKGRVIIHRKAERTDQFVIQNQGLSAGIYIIELIGNERFVGKVMVR